MADRGSLEGRGVWSLGIAAICETDGMGRHSAPGDDELDAGTDTGHGSVAVTQETRDQAGGSVRRQGRHSSPDDVEPEESADGSADDPADGSTPPGGLDLIESALHGPDSEPLRTVRQPRRSARPAPASTADTESRPELHDAPTERIPTVAHATVGEANVDEAATERTDRIPTVGPAAERTDRIPTIAAATVPDGADVAAAEPEVSEVGIDSSGPVVATVDRTDHQSASSARSPRRGTVGDLGLIRRHGDVRARVIAAVIVPFLVFFAVYVLIGALTVRSLIWIWVPAVTAGVLVGLLLDAGHRRYPDAAVTESADPSTPPRTH